MKISHEEHQRQVGAYAQQRHRYEMYAETLKALLRTACADLKIEAAVQARAKGQASFAEKTIRKHRQYPDAIHQMTDLCGARVITYRQSDADRVCDFVRHAFIVDWKNSEDVRLRLKPDQFGYQAMHYIIQMPWTGMQPSVAGAVVGSRAADAAFRQAMVRIAPASYVSLHARLVAIAGPGQKLDLLWTALRTVLQRNPGRWRGCRSELDLVRNIGNRKAEIQVCTVLQHAWAAIGHDRLYKGDFDPPPALKRRIHRTAAMLETVDDELSRAIGEVDEFQQDYGAYMPPERIREEVGAWQTALGKSNDTRISLKIADLAAAVEDWRIVKNTLTPLYDRNAPDRTDPGVLRALGRAKLRSGTGGLKELRAALRVGGENVETLRYLGDLHCGRLTKSRGPLRRHCVGAKYYARMYEAGPTEPYAVLRYLECRFCSGSTAGILPLLRPVFIAARDKSRARAEIHVHMPWSLLDLGELEMLLGRLNESIGAYAKAVFVSDSDLPIRDALAAVKRLQRGLERDSRQAGDLIARVGAVERLLQMAVVAKLHQLTKDAAAALERARAARVLVELQLKDMTDGSASASDFYSPRQIGNKRQDVSRARRVESDSFNRLRRLQAQAGAAQNAFPADALKVREPRTGKPYGNIAGPVVIVVGSCDARYEQDILRYEPLIHAALKHYTGAVFSAGTTAGIGGIVDRMQRVYKSRIRTIAYLPRPLPKGTKEASHYKEIRYMKSGDFSVAQTLQCWVDIVASGIDPCDVKVLGINGGDIAAAEYRIALAFGATVVVLENSGREAARLLPDENWGKSERLVVLPHDEDIAAEVFRNMHDRLPSELNSVLDELAEQAHERFRRSRMQTPPNDLSLVEWDKLDYEYKKSSRAQVDGMLDVLKASGYTWRPRPRELGCVLPRFPKDRLTKAARVEHARFVAQRLLDGWRYGDVKNVELKTNPSLVAWDDLDPSIRRIDRDAVQDFPKQLRPHRIEIKRIKTARRRRRAKRGARKRGNL